MNDSGAEAFELMKAFVRALAKADAQRDAKSKRQGVGLISEAKEEPVSK